MSKNLTQSVLLAGFLIRSFGSLLADGFLLVAEKERTIKVETDFRGTAFKSEHSPHPPAHLCSSLQLWSWTTAARGGGKKRWYLMRQRFCWCLVWCVCPCCQILWRGYMTTLWCTNILWCGLRGMTLCEQAFMANYLFSFEMGKPVCLWELLGSELTQ